ncbi:MAG TPA: 2-dehydropantoate 2-reductase [Chryseolinea sp.]|nr:2-dehydropantoate 2-reductase [Chryseolinea sp.]HPM28967.1 2-dehydropantoate 2-reductase [Chryseolinea sp.]
MSGHNKTIYIIGAGAIGKVLAVFLSKNGKKVILVRGSVMNEPSIKSTIHVELANHSIESAEIEQVTLDALDELNGIVILTNKSFGNPDLALKLKEKAYGSPIVFLQNGLGVEQSFIEEGFKEIYRCVLFATSQTVAENTFRFQPVSESAIGVILGTTTQLNNIVQAVNNSQFPFKAEDHIQKLIWKKAICNSVFNSICPLLDIDNGIFYRNEKALSIAKRVIHECVAVANKANVALTEDEVVANLLIISKASDGQLISTLQDIRNKRPTEIDTFNFAIVESARANDPSQSIRETKLLGELTKLKSELNLC